MTITTHSTHRPAAPGEPADTGRSPARGPIRRIIAGSLVTGLVAAAVLTLVVFAGAAEYAVTGSALLGFALGWAMLAVLSTRMTSQPQRWAWVPAAALAATGLGLLIFAPGDTRPDRRRLGLAAGCCSRSPCGWASACAAPWPPAAAAGCCTRSSPCWPRRRSAARSRPSRWPPTSTAYAMPGQSYDVGGYRLHLNCTGSGSPTVVLKSGLGEFSASWARIAPAVAGTTRVCAYDRAGQGWSDDSPHAPRTACRSPPICTRCWTAPASTARSCSSGTPPAAPTP